MRPSRSPSEAFAELARSGLSRVALFILLVVSCAGGSLSEPSEVPSILVFHRTDGFRHDSIPAGIETLERLGARLGMEVSVTDDPTVFESTRLGAVAAVVFLNTTGDVLDEDGQSEFEVFVRSGGGYLGIHSAADTEHDWPWYGELVGARFSNHPVVQPSTVEFVTSHPIGNGLPPSATMTDEWYNFDDRPDEDVVILAVLDEGTYEGGTMGESHPIAWAHEHEGGRSVYLGFGHTEESFDDPLVLELIADALAWITASDPS